MIIVNLILFVYWNIIYFYHNIVSDDLYFLVSEPFLEATYTRLSYESVS
jgi:hypothetical protein